MTIFRKIMISRTNILIIIFFLFIGYNLYSQQGNPPATPGENKPEPPANNPAVQPPLELPTFIIEGIEHLNIKAGVKQFPSPPTVLSKKELDSVNPLEKQQSLLVAPPQLPKGKTFPNFANGYLQAKAGLYATFDLMAAYGKKYKGYELYGKGGFRSSEGDIKNSEFNKFFININSDYIAPEIFWIFGGSRTRTQASYQNSGFNQYGTNQNLARSTNAFDISLESIGNYEGVNFATGGGFSSFSLDQKSNGIEEKRINGFLNMNTLIDGNLIGAKADLNFGTFQGSSMNLINLAAIGSIYRDKMTIEGEAGYQISNSSHDDSQSTLMIKAVLNYLPNIDYTFRAEFYSGLEKTYFLDYFNKNVYTDDFGNTLFFPKLNASVKGIFQYLPHTKLGISAGVVLKFYEKYPYFNSSDTNTIELLFDKASIINFKAEGFYEISKKDRLNGHAAMNFGTLDYKNNAVPYLPMLESSVAYERNWIGSFGTEIGFLFNSQRYADRDNKNELDSYLNLFVKANYKIFDKFKIIAELQNLTNNDNFIWKGYKERGVFGSLGINWQF